MDVRYKDFFRNIDFEYANENHILQVTIKTNIATSAYLKHWISPKIQDYYHFPIEYKEIFDYDKHGNRISKKIIVQEELFSDIHYLIEY